MFKILGCKCPTCKSERTEILSVGAQGRYQCHCLKCNEVFL